MRLRRTKTLRVFPNPWGVHPSVVLGDGLNVDHSTLDPEGRPCGVICADSFTEGGEPKRLVGAKVCAKHTKVDGVPTKRSTLTVGNIWKPKQTTVYSYLGHTAHETRPYELADKLASAEPITLPYSEYYRAHLVSGELIPADEATATEAGVTYADPASLFPALARAAAKAFDANYDGDTAYEHFVSERAKAAPESVAAAPSAAPSIDARASAPADVAKASTPPRAAASTSPKES